MAFLIAQISNRLGKTKHSKKTLSLHARHVFAKLLDIVKAPTKTSKILKMALQFWQVAGSNGFQNFPSLSPLVTPSIRFKFKS